MTEILRTETNSPAVERDIRRTARKLLGLSALNMQTDFEHGQWWVTERHTGAQWSVCDEYGELGFCFEQVTQGEDA